MIRGLEHRCELVYFFIDRDTRLILDVPILISELSFYWFRDVSFDFH